MPDWQRSLLSFICPYIAIGGPKDVSNSKINFTDIEQSLVAA